MAEFFELHEEFVVDLLGRRLQDGFSARGYSKVSASRYFDQLRLTQIRFSPMHPVAEDGLLPGR
jgi:hypothetical protein